MHAVVNTEKLPAATCTAPNTGLSPFPDLPLKLGQFCGRASDMNVFGVGIICEFFVIVPTDSREGTSMNPI